jgi:flagellar hook-associated protein 2
MAISLTGLASGLDTETVIAQLMAIEQNKVTAVKWREISVTQHKNDLNTVKSKLDALKTAVNDLSLSSTWKPVQTTASSDPTKVDVAVLGGAGIGGYSIQVDKLASSAQHGFAYTPNAAAGKLTLYYGNDPGADGASKVTIDVPENATAQQLADAVNANEGSPVYAAIVKDGAEERIVFSARKTGESGDFTVDTSQLAGGQLTEIGTYARTGSILNASYRFDGEAVARTSESNVLEDLIPGVRVTLKGVTTSPASISTSSPAINTDEIIKKIQAVVDAYNAVVTTTRSEMSEKKVPGASSTLDLQKGQLFGDTGLSSMLTNLKRTMTQTLSGLGINSLAEIGIDVPKSSGGASSEDAKAGKLTLDTEKLKAALNADYTKVREAFMGAAGVDGFSKTIAKYVDSQTGKDGVLTGRMESDDTTLKNFAKQIEKLNERMATQEKRLRAQFAAMETALNFAQTQQAWLTSQIATLPTYSY